MRRQVTILVADDDPDDRLMIKDAFEAAGLSSDVRFVQDGVELMSYLKHDNGFKEMDQSPRPGVILLDINMPRKDGLEALAEIKADPSLRLIPVIVLTTSKSERDVLRSYDLSAASYITKPITFDELTAMISSVGKYWLQTVELPQACGCDENG